MRIDLTPFRREVVDYILRIDNYGSYIKVGQHFGKSAAAISYAIHKLIQNDLEYSEIKIQRLIKKVCQNAEDHCNRVNTVAGSIKHTCDRTIEAFEEDLAVRREKKYRLKRQEEPTELELIERELYEVQGKLDYFEEVKTDAFFLDYLKDKISSIKEKIEEVKKK